MHMQIKPEEVEEVKVIGRLFGDDVKMVKTKGGFHVAMGKRERNSRKADALAAGSHAALVSYQLEKMHGHDFEPAIFKSEADQLPEVEEKTDILPTEAQNAGIELFILNKSNNLDFVMCKHGVELAKYETEYSSDELVIKSYKFRQSISPNRFVSEAMGTIIDQKMKELNLTKVKNENR